MLTLKDLLDLEDEIYKLEGLASLLNAWSNEEGGYEISFISEALNNTTKSIAKIVKRG